MPLSPQDQQFYADKLSWKSFAKLMGATMLIGAIGMPGMLFTLDWSAGAVTKWNGNLIFNLALYGVMLGIVMSVVMYLLFRFFLSIGWLPSRR